MIPPPFMQLIPGSPAGPASGFDPNEDPVIIGGNSEITDGTTTATPDNPDPTFAGNVVIGGDAFYTANPADDPEDGTVVLGASASAAAGRAISIGSGGDSGSGPQVQLGAIGGIAIGSEIDRFNPAASAGGAQDIAVGVAANVTGAGAGAAAVGVGASVFANGEGATAYGPGAVAIAAHATAVGYQARASGQPSSGSVALGTFAEANGPESDIAIGYHAIINSHADRSICIGGNAAVDASGNDATIIGDHATNNGHTSCAAIGSAAQNTRDNQVMLGAAGASQFAETDLGYVVTDTDGSGNRWIIQVTGGIITLSPAP